MASIGTGGVSISSANHFRKANQLGSLQAFHGCSRPRCGTATATATATGRRLRIIAMASKKKVNKYDPGWKKEWFGAGIFLEGSEDIEMDVFKTVEKRKVLSNVEKAGLLSKAEGLGFTLSSIEKLGLLSKAEQFGLLSFLENSVALSPAALASVSLPLFLAAVAAVVVIPDDSFPLVAAQTALSVTCFLASASLFVASIILDGLQAD